MTVEAYYMIEKADNTKGGTVVYLEDEQVSKALALSFVPMPLHAGVPPMNVSITLETGEECTVSSDDVYMEYGDYYRLRSEVRKKLNSQTF